MNNKNVKLPNNVKQGLIAFNQKSYYQAHEYFEDAWRGTSDPSREFYRALLHISGGFYRLTQGKPDGSQKFFEHALKWLDVFDPHYLGFNLIKLKQTLNLMICEIENHTLPKIILERHASSIFQDIEGEN